MLKIYKVHVNLLNKINSEKKNKENSKKLKKEERDDLCVFSKRGGSYIYILRCTTHKNLNIFLSQLKVEI